MTNKKSTSNSESSTLQTKPVEKEEITLEDSIEQGIPKTINSMMLSNSIVDTNCKDIGIKNIETQLELAKLSCEHPECTNQIMEFAKLAAAADQRATERFEIQNETIVSIIQYALPIIIGAVAGVGYYGYRNKWFPIHMKVK